MKSINAAFHKGILIPQVQRDTALSYDRRISDISHRTRNNVSRHDLISDVLLPSLFILRVDSHPALALHLYLCPFTHWLANRHLPQPL